MNSDGGGAGAAVQGGDSGGHGEVAQIDKPIKLSSDGSSVGRRKRKRKQQLSSIAAFFKSLVRSGLEARFQESATGRRVRSQGGDSHGDGDAGIAGPQRDVVCDVAAAIQSHGGGGLPATTSAIQSAMGNRRPPPSSHDLRHPATTSAIQSAMLDPWEKVGMGLDGVGVDDVVDDTVGADDGVGVDHCRQIHHLHGRVAASSTVPSPGGRTSVTSPSRGTASPGNGFSATVFASYFTARNISFKNTAPAPLPGMEGWQAAAFRISGDKASFLGCGFYGAQDTLCDDAGRHYFKECYIEGSIDFVFGNGRSMYKSCQLNSIATRFGSIAAQDRKSPCEKTGFAFVNCTVTGTGPLYVGRAMGQYSRIVYSYTYFDNVVAPGGWDDWDHAAGKNRTAFFGVYKCWGPGAAAVRGVSWARELDYQSARPFMAKSFVNGRHWLDPSDA